MQDELPLGEAMNAPYIVPFGKLAVLAEIDTRIFRFKLEPNYPVSG